MSVKMTRQHFQFIADTLVSIKYCFDIDDIYPDIVNIFCNDLAETNAQFDQIKFLAACEAESE